MKDSPENQHECYCCQEIGTTKDHIPPKCFFPKKEDLPEGYLDKTRGNLITVPSCEQHNNGRSKDDEYTAAFLAINSYEASSLAKRMSETKWQRALKRHGYSLLKRIFANSTPVGIISTTPSGLLIHQPTVIVSCEVERIYNVIKSIALGIYYLESGYKEKWNHNCIIRSPNFLYRDLSEPKDMDFLVKLNEEFTNVEYHPKLMKVGCDNKGDYPEIFYYQFFRNPEDKLHKIRMVFYDHFVFFAFLEP